MKNLHLAALLLLSGSVPVFAQEAKETKPFDPQAQQTNRWRAVKGFSVTYLVGPEIYRDTDQALLVKQAAQELAGDHIKVLDRTNRDDLQLVMKASRTYPTIEVTIRSFSDKGLPKDKRLFTATARVYSTYPTQVEGDTMYLSEELMQRVATISVDHDAKAAKKKPDASGQSDPEIHEAVGKLLPLLLTDVKAEWKKSHK